MTLVGPLSKAISWIPWLATTALIGLILWGTNSLSPDFASRQIYIRGALLTAALGLCFVYDDPASETSDPMPSPLRIRRAIRALLGMIPWAVLVTATVLIAGRRMDHVFILPEPVVGLFPVGRVILEAATLAAWGLAVAALISKRWDEEPGKYASAAVLVLYATSWTVPEHWKPWANPDDPRWETALPWWWLALGVGMLVMIAYSWDSRIGWRRRRLTKSARALRSKEAVVHARVNNHR